jgi:hypothetical protein
LAMVITFKPVKTVNNYTTAHNKTEGINDKCN